MGTLWIAWPEKRATFAVIQNVPVLHPNEYSTTGILERAKSNSKKPVAGSDLRGETLMALKTLNRKAAGQF